MRTSWEKLIQYDGTKYVQDISKELNKKIKINILTSVHSDGILVRRDIKEAPLRTV